MTEHTPGPWSFEDNQAAIGHYLIIGRQGPLTVYPAVAHGLPDARLIAAAPDLLEALRGLSAGMSEAVDSNPRVRADEVKAARAAIRKATGTR